MWQIDEHLAGRAREFDLPHRLLHGDGTYRWTSCHGVVSRNESGRAVRLMGCHSDVTAEKVADALTGLPNRQLFMDHLARPIERVRRNPTHHFAVLLVDLGRTGPHEGAAGVKAPDAVLTAAARRLEACLRAGDGGVVRLSVSGVAEWADATLSLGEPHVLLAPPLLARVARLATTCASSRCYGDLAGCALLLQGRAEAWIEAAGSGRASLCRKGSQVGGR